MSTAKFHNVQHLAEFCAALTKNGIRYDVVSYDETVYIVNITGF